MNETRAAQALYEVKREVAEINKQISLYGTLTFYALCAIIGLISAIFYNLS